MKLRSALILMGLILVYSASVVASAKRSPSVITIGFIPGENADTLRENATEFAKLLKNHIHLDVNVMISKDYSGLIEAMKSKKVDFAFFSAMTFVFAEKMAHAKVLLKKVWDSPYYYSTILVRTSSGIKTLKDLKKKKIAFVDKKSTSGFLYPQVQFLKERMDPQSFFAESIFTGNHEASVKSLIDGKVDAIAVFSDDREGKITAWAKYSPSFKAAAQKIKVKPIWISEPIPNDPFCVRQDFYESFPKTAHDVMFAMIELQEDPKAGQKFLDHLGVSSLMLATSQQYNPVREMVQKLKLKLE